jgi:spore photoproduct lyase
MKSNMQYSDRAGNCLMKPFSHIYVEDRVRVLSRTAEILKKFPNAKVIPIHHYKDVFNRRKQNYHLQHETRALILACKEGQLVYPGAPVCQSFGNEHFYYSSSMMNCVFDCEYCYLKGMYPSGNIVLFLNLEDIFREVEMLLQKHAVYLCASYDTDLLAMEACTGYVREWTRFTAEHPGLSIEIRTKSAANFFWDTATLSDRNIFAWTLSPERIIQTYEHDTGSLAGRLASIRRGLELGFPVRLCFDPMLYCPDWKEAYGSMLEQVACAIPMDRIRDVSVGSFRLSQEYLQAMRKNMPDSAVVQYPYVNDHGVYHYPEELTEEMERFLVDRLRQMVPEERIFRWEDSDALT